MQKSHSSCQIWRHHSRAFALESSSNKLFFLTSEDSHSTNLSSESAESFLIEFFQISHPEISHWMKKSPFTWLDLVSWKQNAHREDQCPLSIAGAYPVMSTWGTTPFRHHLQKGFLPEAQEHCLQWQHLCFPRSWTQCYISETCRGLWLKMSILAPNPELRFWLKLSYSLFSLHKLIRN